MQISAYVTNTRFFMNLGLLPAAFVLFFNMDAEASVKACKQIHHQTMEHIADKKWCLAQAGLSHVSKACDISGLSQSDKEFVQTNLKKTTAECDSLDAQNFTEQGNTAITLEKKKLLCGAPFSDDGTSTNACLAMGAAVGARSVRVIPFNDKTLPIQLDKGEIHVAINNGRSVQKPTYVHVSQHGFVAFHVQPAAYAQVAKIAFESLDERTPKNRLKELNKLGVQLGLDSDWQENVIDSYGTIDNLRGDKSYLKQN